MEDIPWISQETLKVFDCANIPYGGTRCIATEAHVKMLGALKPFISGASSKTINMPSSATEEDIANSLVESHELGVKCIAIYRDGSKANAVYSTRLDSTEVQEAWQQLLKTATQIRIQEHANPIRKRLPYRRWGQTVKFTIGNDINGFMTVGISETGTCAEIFGHLGQAGSFINGMFDAFCKAFSIALQYGVPFDSFISSFRYMSFDPSGWVKIGEYQEEDKPEIHNCKSIVDLLMQLLDWMFPAENERRLRSLDQNYISEMFSNANHTLKIKSVEHKPMQTELPLMATPPTKKKTDKAMSSALTCPKCHSYAYVFDGKCRSCRDCGYKDGGCGA
jgi:ribonucleoside-diphosphate reductase alpha chain